MIRDLKINDTYNKKYYRPYDIPTLPKHKVIKARKQRKDLSSGQIVVVLEGKFAGSRVVYVNSLPNYQALCCGPKSVNDIPFFKIDERFLLPTGTIFKADLTNSLKEDDVSPCDAEDFKENEEMRKMAGKIDHEVGSIKMMKTYLSTKFSLPENIDFYDLKF
ncbi:hypothetical protein EDEG_03266 [Edhazardia aedis USNM 41457]|uniref:60S ribosomal protein L6 n=1 Tax=Edhazardia aedis (strain USNM 41457) TaxID=1003232 RepID=J9DLQ1_EDHAE|nr:hypothetical protein EDEG_03266 [Edhazardia aedis USNM 41457]|eukprot:EJW02302.1 hypothetical protein EDEG_03266 [Edhazardia aedis USNM 41457]